MIIECAVLKKSMLALYTGLGDMEEERGKERKNQRMDGRGMCWEAASWT